MSFEDDVFTEEEIMNTRILTELPSLQRVKSLRDDVVAYGWFCTIFLPCVIGTKEWQSHYRRHELGEFVSTSDEAFALVNYENNVERWLDMYKRRDLKASDVRAQWTNSGDSVKDGKSKRFRGWAEAGVAQYNAHYKAVRADRAEYPDFETTLLEGFCEENGKVNDVATVDATVLGWADEEPLNDMPWSRVEEAAVADNVGSEDDEHLT